MSAYSAGDVVQLRSGGPLLCVTNNDGTENTNVIYYNAVSGTFERVSIKRECLRVGSQTPQTPEGTSQIRRTGLAP